MLLDHMHQLNNNKLASHNSKHFDTTNSWAPPIFIFLTKFNSYANAFVRVFLFLDSAG